MEPQARDGAGPIARGPRVLVVSETRLYREGLAEVLGAEGSLTVCGHSSGADEALGAVTHLSPDVVLLDAAAREGLGLVAAMTKAAPRARVVVFALAEVSEGVIAWAEAGASGYIPQTTPLANVASIVLGILEGGQACPPSLTSAMFRRLHELGEATGLHYGASAAAALTARELQIAELINAGLSNKQIARQLRVGVATIKSHVHNLLGKLDVHRRGQVVGRLGAARRVEEVKHPPGPGL